MSRAPFDTVVNFYSTTAYGVLGALMGSEPGRFVAATHILDATWEAGTAEAYVTCEGTTGPWLPVVTFPAAGEMKFQYFKSYVLEDDANPGLYWQIIFVETVVFPAASYLRYHITPWPFP